tara:strand:+ start:142 stop:333 length:192 start_codon:yes stop_codon:yes gene_type:complete
MKITIEQHEEIISINTQGDHLTTSEIAELMARMCDALGYHPGSIGEAFYQIGEERVGSEDNNG